MPYKDPERRRLYQKARYSHAHAAASSITRTLSNALAAAQGLSINQSQANPAIESAQSALALILLAKGLSIPKTVRKVKQRMESKSLKTVAGEREVWPDNDAQLKAVEIAMELQTRAGLLPSDKQHNGSGNITLNVISYTNSAPQEIVIESKVIESE